jgi:phosphatidylserine/phosphatidylglycerophosphate/cardiolipin synthase-like enzyme
VWSPTDSQSHLLALINGAQHSLDIEEEEFSDTAIVVSYSDPNGFYIHAKAIVADYGTSTAKVFLGSENFSDNSLNDNRELGLIISDPAVLGGVESTFNADFGQTTSGTVTVTAEDGTGAGA